MLEDLTLEVCGHRTLVCMDEGVKPVRSDEGSKPVRSGMLEEREIDLLSSVKVMQFSPGSPPGLQALRRTSLDFFANEEYAASTLHR